MLTCSGVICAKGTFHIWACTWRGHSARPTTVATLLLSLTFQLATHSDRPSSRSWPKSFIQILERKVGRCALIGCPPKAGAPCVPCTRCCWRSWSCSTGAPWPHERRSCCFSVEPPRALRRKGATLDSDICLARATELSGLRHWHIVVVVIQSYRKFHRKVLEDPRRSRCKEFSGMYRAFLNA